MLELAKEYDCAIRYPFTHDIPSELEETYLHVPALLREFDPRRPDAFYVDFYDEGATDEELLRILNKLNDGTSEIMCHPGYVDDAFANESVYNFQRERELKILTDLAVKQALAERHIHLTTFGEL